MHLFCVGNLGSNIFFFLTKNMLCSMVFKWWVLTLNNFGLKLPSFYPIYFFAVKWWGFLHFKQVPLIKAAVLKLKLATLLRVAKYFSKGCQSSGLSYYLKFNPGENVKTVPGLPLFIVVCTCSILGSEKIENILKGSRYKKVCKPLD
jgi:hypothetical protein